MANLAARAKIKTSTAHSYQQRKSGQCGHGLRGVGQLSAQGQPIPLVAGGKKAVVADFSKAWREDMQQETPDKLLCVQRHQLHLIVVSIVTPAKRDFTIFQR